MFRTALSLVIALAAVLLCAGRAAAADPSPGEWPTTGNGPSHTGYYPKQIGPAQFIAGWSKVFANPVNQVAVSSGLVFGVGTGTYNQDVRAFALAVYDGAEVWTFPLPASGEVSSPTYSDGSLYFRVGQNSLWSLQAASGRLRFTTSYEAGNTSGAPTVALGTAFVGGGAPGRIRRFDDLTGAERPPTDPLVLQYPTVSNYGTASPAVADGLLYACSGGIFSAHDPETNAPLWSLDLRRIEGSIVEGWSDGSIPVVSNGTAVVRGGDRLAAVDLATRSQRWIKTASPYDGYFGTPSIADGKVYVIWGADVKAYDVVGGALLGTYSASGRLWGQPLVTKDLVLASNGTETFVFDRATFGLRQILPAGGSLSYAAGRLFIVNSPFNGASTLSTFTVATTESDPAPPPLPATPLPQPQPNPDRPLPPTTAGWLDMAQAGNIAYFLFATPAKIERYDLSASGWLPPISLPADPKGITISDDAIYVSFAASVSKFPLDGSTETILAATPATMKTLFELNGRLYLTREWAYDIFCMDPATGKYLHAENYFNGPRGLSVNADTGHFYGRTSGIPGDIYKTTINPDGSFGQQMDSPYHGVYPAALRTFVMPGGTRVIEDSGTIYSAADLTYLGSLGAFKHIGFYGSAPVVLRPDDSLVAYSSALVEAGRVALPTGHDCIAVGGGFVHAFAQQDGRGVSVTRTSLASLGRAEPGGAPDPVGLAYTPDAVVFGGDTVYLLSKLHQAIFRWSISEQRYLASIPLSELPSSMCYSAEHERLYLGYASGRISKIGVTQGLGETAFADLPATPTVILAAGELICFASKATYATWTFFTYAANGTRVAAKTDADIMEAPVWCPVQRRIVYKASNDSSRLRAIAVNMNGTFGGVIYGPFSTGTDVSPPVAVAPDGSQILLDNGAAYHPATLLPVATLSVPTPPKPPSYPYTPRPRISDATWHEGVLHTARDVYPFGATAATSGAIESWSGDLTARAGAPTNGRPLRVHPLADGVLLVSMVDGRPDFAAFNTALEQTSSAPGNHPPATTPVARANPVRVLAPTAGPWIRAVKHGGLAYFLFDAPAKLERYDLDADAWLAPISLPDGPREFVVGASGIYVSFGALLSRFSLDGSTETPLLTAAINVRPLAEHKGRIYFANTDQTSTNARFGAADVLTGVISAEMSYSYPMGEIAFSPAREKFFGVPPPGGRLRQIALLPDGAFGAQTENVFSGSSSFPVRPYLLPGETRILASSGNAFSTADLSYVGGLVGGPFSGFNDLDFVGDHPVALQGDALVAYSPTLVRAGEVPIPVGALRVFAADGAIVAFRPGANRGVAATRTVFTDFLPPPVDPSTLAYVPSAIEFGGDTVYLVSSQHRAVFRWSISQERYLPSIPLLSTPQRIAYSPAQNRLYLSYSNGRIGKIDLTTTTVETNFVTLPLAPASMFPVGNLMFFGDNHPVFWNASNLYLYAADGSLVSSASPGMRVQSPVWSEALRRIFFNADGSYDFKVWDIDEAGQFSATPVSPPPTNYGVSAPIFPAPDGSLAVFANAAVFSGSDLARIGNLPVPVQPSFLGYPNRPAITDCAWLAGILHTVRGTYSYGAYTPDGGVIESWSSELSVSSSGLSRGEPLRLRALADGLLLISVLDGRPVFAKYSSALQQLSSQPGDNPPPLTRPLSRPNPARVLAPATGPWIGSATHGGIAYFLFDAPGKVERYDIANGIWLEPISLPPAPRSFAVGENGIYVSFGKELSRFSLNGATEVLLFAAGAELQPLAEYQGRIYLRSPSPSYGYTNFAAIDIVSGALVAQTTIKAVLDQLTFSAVRAAFFGREGGGAGSSLARLPLQPDGAFGLPSTGPVTSTALDKFRVVLMPDETRMISADGIISDTADFSYVGSLGGAIADVAFSGNLPVVLRNGNALFTYSNAFVETGRKSIAGGQAEIAVAGGFVHSFAPSGGRGVAALKTALSSIHPVQPPLPVNPVGLTYTPDAIELGGDVVFLLSQVHQSIFRWSVSERRYLDTIPLTDVALHVTHSEELNRLYVSYPGGRITRIDLANSVAETEFVNLPGTAFAIQATGEFLFANFNPHFGIGLATYAPDGSLLSTAPLQYLSTSFTWSAQNRRLYWFRENHSPIYLHWTSINPLGVMDENGEAFGEFLRGDRLPIRVGPDGSVLLLGNGDLRDPLSLTQIGSLAIEQPPGNPWDFPQPAAAVTDAAWLDGQLYTISNAYGGGSTTPTGGRIQRWTADGQQAAARGLPIIPLRLFTAGQSLLILSVQGQRPTFDYFTPDFLVEPDPDPETIDFTQVSGTYFASLSSGLDSPVPFHALVKLTIGANGSATGSFRIDGKTVVFKTQFDALGGAGVSLNVRGEKCVLVFNLLATSDGPSLVGRLQFAASTFDFTARRAGHAASPGRHVFLLHGGLAEAEVPPVAGFGAVTISARGSARITGRLFLGGPVSQSSVVLEDGSMAFALSTTRQGFVSGGVVPADLPDSDWSGSLHWFRPAPRANEHFAQEIDTTLAYTATRHEVTRPPLPATGNQTRVAAQFDGGDLDGTFLLAGRILLSGQIFPSSTWSSTIGFVNPVSGFVRGTFRHPETRRPVVFQGVINAKVREARGGFLGPRHGGHFRIYPEAISPPVTSSSDTK